MEREREKETCPFIFRWLLGGYASIGLINFQGSVVFPQEIAFKQVLTLQYSSLPEHGKLSTALWNTDGSSGAELERMNPRGFPGSNLGRLLQPFKVVVPTNHHPETGFIAIKVIVTE